MTTGCVKTTYKGVTSHPCHPPRRDEAPRFAVCSLPAVDLSPVSIRACTVSFTGPSGVRHTVEVTAESLYEAAALALQVLRRDAWVDQIAPGTEIEVQVRAPSAKHLVTLQQLRRWADGVAVNPDETLKKRRLKKLLA